MPQRTLTEYPAVYRGQVNPALYLPLPLYVYVGIRELEACEATRILFRQPDRARPRWVPLDVTYQAKLEDALDLLAPASPPLEIAVWSQAPTMCGLGTSSAIAACLARYLHRKGLVEPDGGFAPLDVPANTNLLGPKGPFPKSSRYCDGNTSAARSNA